MSAPPQNIEDWRRFPTSHTIIGLTHAGEDLQIAWDDGRNSAFHRFFLRDNCTCATCYLPLTREQVFEIADAGDDLAVADAAIDADGGLAVTWSDGHLSHYSPGWLRAHAPDAASRVERLAARARRLVWQAEFADAIPHFAYGEVMTEDAALFGWLSALRETGLVLMHGVPVQEEALLAPVQRIGHLRETNFGRIFDVRSKAVADSAAYTAIELPPHTDLPTRELQPGVQFLHCLINDAAGGASVFLDGFALAEAMREQHPREFATLTTTPLAFWNRDAGTDYRWHAPVIALDAQGEIAEVRFANFLRGPVDVAAEAMAEVYAALRCFQRLQRDSHFLVERRLVPGEMWVFDNRRVMHARRAFDPASGDRHFQGTYIDRDEIESRWHVLSRQLSEPSHGRNREAALAS